MLQLLLLSLLPMTIAVTSITATTAQAIVIAKCYCKLLLVFKTLLLLVVILLDSQTSLTINDCVACLSSGADKENHTGGLAISYVREQCLGRGCQQCSCGISGAQYL